VSELIRSLIPRLATNALRSDFVDERSLADVVQKQYGNPLEPTAMAQLQLQAQGKGPTPMTTKVQLDRS